MRQKRMDEIDEAIMMPVDMASRGAERTTMMPLNSTDTMVSSMPGAMVMSMS